MKKLIVFFTLFAVLGLTNAAAQTSSASAPAAELSFTFTRQTGAASNQFAVWIEDTQGRYITTLYATRYTANGGWKRRASSIPLWVKQSGLSGMTKAQVDALTSATPKAGTLTYQWNGTDSRGAACAAGSYVICLEGTLRWENQAVYRAPIKIGEGAAPAQVSVEYIGTPGIEQAMISNVTARALR